MCSDLLLKGRDNPPRSARAKLEPVLRTLRRQVTRPCRRGGQAALQKRLRGLKSLEHGRSSRIGYLTSSNSFTHRLVACFAFLPVRTPNRLVSFAYSSVSITCGISCLRLLNEGWRRERQQQQQQERQRCRWHSLPPRQRRRDAAPAEVIIVLPQCAIN